MREVPDDLMDAHYLPELYWGTAQGMGWWPHLAVARVRGGMAVMPFLVTQDQRLVSAHNFGGPLASSDAAGCALCVELDGWARNLGIEGQINLLPFRGKSQRLFVRTSDWVRDAVWVDLGQVILRGTTRRCAENAEQSGVVVQVREPTAALRDFQHIYWSSMVRVGAENRWLYPPGFFPSVMDALGKNATLLVADRKDWEHPEAGAILVHSHGTCYYHWAGSLNRFPRLGVSHLLVREAISWARDAGYQRVYLGGGLRPGDGLEVFKRGFSPLREPVYRFQVG